MKLKGKCAVKAFSFVIVAVMLSFVGKMDHTFATEKFAIMQIKGARGNEYKIYFTSDNLPTDKTGILKNVYAYLSSDNGTNWIKTEVWYEDKNCYHVWPTIDDPTAEDGYRDVLTPSTIYQMYVVNQNGEQSETIEVATGAKYDPDADDAKEYEITVKGCTETTCTISWDAVDGANGYVLTTYDSKDKKVDIAITNTNSYTIQGKTLPLWNKSKSEMLTELEKIYVYPCFLFNNLCLEADEYIGSVYPVFQPSKPVVTWNWSTFRKLVEFSVKTNYNDDNTAIYKIQCYDLKTGKKVAAKRTAAYCITNTKRDTIYKFRVKQGYYCKNNGKIYYSKWSDDIYALPEAVSDAKRNSDGSIKVTWNKVNKATGYDIYVKKEGTKKKVKVASVGKSATSYTIKTVNGANLSQSSTYEIYVVSKKKVGKKTYVSEKDFGVTVY